MQHNFIQLLAIFGSGLLSPAAIQAQLVLDGSLGQVETLMGPEYQIGAELGQQQGGNLFHSFQDFNLQSHETATFSGPDTVHNIISRVTGGSPSNIDGLIRSTIPNADFYLLNPYGILFGPHAKLDVQGSFHVSTADYLRLDDGGRFEARYPNNSLLTSAPVAAFGFLTETPAFIKTQDSQLEVPNGKTLSWIGGRVEFNGNMPLSYDENDNIVANSWLLAKSGRLNLASVASRGEVIPTSEGLDLMTSTTGGLLTATNTFFSTSSEVGSGQVWIRAGQFQMTHSQIENNTVEQAAGNTNIQADNVTFEDGASIDSNTNGAGAGGSINLKVADDLTLRGNYNNSGDSWFYTRSTGTMPQAGASGNIFIQARNVNLAEGAQISSSTSGTGQGGTINLQVTEALTTIGLYAEGNLSGVFASSENEELANAGNAGDVIIQARQINLSNRARISSSTWGLGQGGKIHLEVAEALTVVTNPEDTYSNLPGVYARSYNQGNSGNAGDVTIHARNINLAGGAMLSSDTYGTGQGGKVHLEIADTLASNNGKIYADSNNTDLEKAGNAGGVILRARNVNLTENAVISSGTSGAGQGGTVYLEVLETLASKNGRIFTTSFNIYENSDNSHLGPAGNVMIQAREVKLGDGAYISSDAYGPGAAGNVIIQARQIDLTAGASISSASNSTGQGGTVHLEVADTLAANDSSIYVDSNNSDLETAGNAGDIIIQARQVDIINGAQIRSDTWGTGQSGTVNLEIADTLSANNGKIYADSNNTDLEKSGKAGDIILRARNINLTEESVISSGTFGAGQSGTVHLEGVDTLKANNSSIHTDSNHSDLEIAGNAGNIIIQARQVDLINGAQISSDTWGTGQSGTVNLEIADTLSANNGKIYADSNNTDLEKSGKAGGIILRARNINLTEESVISSDTFGAGQSGTVHLEIVDTLTANNSSIHTDSNQSDLETAGNAGNIIIQARQIDLINGAQIRSSTFGAGQSGMVHLQIAETLTATGIHEEGHPSAVATTSEDDKLTSAGAAGNLRIEAHQITLTNGGKLTSGTWGTGAGGTLSLQVEDILTIAGQAVNGRKSSVVASSRGTMENAGPAGLLNIQAKTINILKDGEISTQSENAGGGDLTLFSPNFLYLQQGQITASVKGGEANSGNITIENPQFMILSSGQIVAQADAGRGGNIRIVADHLLTTLDSLISASSRLGIDGQVDITSPDINISNGLLGLSNQLRPVNLTFKNSCGVKTWEEFLNLSTFFAHSLAGRSWSPFDLQPSFIK